MIRIAVCDDEKIFVDLIGRMIKKEFEDHGYEIKIEGYLNGEALLAHHKIENFDLVFLDIIMPDMDGFSVARELTVSSHERTLIVFVTTENQLVYDSFDYHPFHFITKSDYGVLGERLKHVTNQLLNRLSDRTPICFHLFYNEKAYIFPQDIQFLKSKGNYMMIHKKDGTELQIRGSVDEIIGKLPERLFVRIHNRYIVNMNLIKKIDYSNASVLMVDNKEIAFSRSYKNLLIERYNDYLRNYN